MPDLEIADCINENCPWSGKPVQPDALTEYHGEVVGFCNTGCRDKFEAVVRHFGDRCEPPAAVRRAASPERTPTGTPRTPPRPPLRSTAARRSAEAPSRGHKPVLAPPAKPQYRCSCAVCFSCRNRDFHNSISAKTPRTTQLIQTPLSNIAPGGTVRGRGPRLQFVRQSVRVPTPPVPSHRVRGHGRGTVPSKGHRGGLPQSEAPRRGPGGGKGRRGHYPQARLPVGR